MSTQKEKMERDQNTAMNNAQNQILKGQSSLDGLKGINFNEELSDEDKARRDNFLDNLFNKEQQKADATRASMAASGLGYLYDPNYSTTKGIDTRPLQEGEIDFGTSKYDEGLLNEFDNETIQNQRASNQSGIAQLGAGVAKMGVLTASTAIDGTAGLLYGLSSFAKSGDFHDMWNNDLSNWLDSWSTWADEAMPQYQSTYAQNNEWYGNLGRANFWSDVIKNSGFMWGAMLGGKVPATLLGKGAGRVASWAGKTAEEIDKISAGAAQVGGVLGAAANESGVQARETYKKALEAYAKPVNDRYNEQIRSIDSEIAQIDSQLAELSKYVNSPENPFGILPEIQEEYNRLMDAKEARTKNRDAIENQRRAEMKEYEEYAFAAGNLDFAQNMAILAPMDLIGIGKMYRRGFDKSVESGLVKGVWGDYTAGKKSMFGIASNMVNEGAQEIAQSISSNTALKYNAANAINHYNNKYNPDAQKEVADYMNSLIDGFAEGIVDPQAWEEAFSVFLTMGVGHPTIRSKSEMKDADGKTKGRFGWEGSIFNEYSDIKNINEKTQMLVDHLNEVSKTRGEATKTLFNNLAHHRYMDKVMDKALAEKDEFTYRNAEMEQMIGDIAAFSRAGRIEDLRNAIKNASEFDDEGIADLISSTTEINDKGELYGPFSEYAKKDGEGNVISQELSDTQKKEILDKINKNVDKQMELIDSWDKTRRSLFSRYGNENNSELIDELTYMKLFMDHYPDRVKEMSASLKDVKEDLVSRIKSSFALEESQKKQRIEELENEILNANTQMNPTIFSEEEGKEINKYRWEEKQAKYNEDLNNLDRDIEEKTKQHQDKVKSLFDEKSKKENEFEEFNQKYREEKESLQKTLEEQKKHVRSIKAKKTEAKDKMLEKEATYALNVTIEKMESIDREIKKKNEEYKKAQAEYEAKVKEVNREFQKFINEQHNRKKEIEQKRKDAQQKIDKINIDSELAQHQISRLQRKRNEVEEEYETYRNNLESFNKALENILNGNIQFFALTNTDRQMFTELRDKINEALKAGKYDESTINTVANKFNDMILCAENMAKIREQYNKYISDLSNLEKDIKKADEKADRDRIISNLEEDARTPISKRKVTIDELNKVIDDNGVKFGDGESVDNEGVKGKIDEDQVDNEGVREKIDEGSIDKDDTPSIAALLLDDKKKFNIIKDIVDDITPTNDAGKQAKRLIERSLNNIVNIKDFFDPTNEFYAYPQNYIPIGDMSKDDYDTLIQNVKEKIDYALKEIKKQYDDNMLIIKEELGIKSKSKNTEQTKEETKNDVEDEDDEDFGDPVDYITSETIDQSVSSDNYNIFSTSQYLLYFGKEKVKEFDELFPMYVMAQKLGRSIYNEYTEERNKRLEIVWKYLNDKGVFDDRNNKPVEKGTQIKYVVDYDLCKKIHDELGGHITDDNNFVILMAVEDKDGNTTIDGKNYRIVGDVKPEWAIKSDTESEVIPGLRGLISNVRNEFTKSGVTEGIFDSGYTNEVKAEYEGKLALMKDKNGKKRFNFISEIFSDKQADGTWKRSKTRPVFEVAKEDDKKRKLKKGDISVTIYDRNNNDGKKIRITKPKSLNELGKSNPYYKYVDKEVDELLDIISNASKDNGDKHEAVKELAKMFYLKLGKGGSYSSNGTKDTKFAHILLVTDGKNRNTLFVKMSDLIKNKNKRNEIKKFLYEDCYLNFDYKKIEGKDMSDLKYQDIVADALKLEIFKGQYRLVSPYFTLYALDPNGNMVKEDNGAKVEFSWNDKGDNDIIINKNDNIRVVENQGRYTLYNKDGEIIAKEIESFKDLVEQGLDDNDEVKKQLAQAYVMRNAFAGDHAIRIPILGNNIYYMMDRDTFVDSDKVAEINKEADKNDDTKKKNGKEAVRAELGKKDNVEEPEQKVAEPKSPEFYKSVLGSKMAYESGDVLKIVELPEIDGKVDNAVAEEALAEAIVAIEQGASVVINNNNEFMIKTFNYMEGYKKVEDENGYSTYELDPDSNATVADRLNGKKEETNDNDEISDVDEFAEEWSKKEGWSVDYFKKEVLPHIKKGEAYQVEFELVDDNEKASFSGQMVLSYDGNNRDEVKSDNTLDAIKNGERSATTRWANMDYWNKVKVGDIIEFHDKNDNKVKVKVTKAFTKLSINKKSSHDNNTSDSSKSKEIKYKNIKSADKDFDRNEVEKDTDNLYIFTDNTNRTSGRNKIDDDSDYAKKYGKGLKYPGQTQAVIRGLNNAMPISTQRYYDPKNGLTYEKGNWNDEDFEEFKKVIDEEIEDIKNKFISGNYKNIIIGTGDALFNGKISNITKDRCPKIYDYLESKIEELDEFIGDSKNQSSSELSQESTEKIFDDAIDINKKHIIFNENEHTYTIDGNVTDYTVTGLAHPMEREEETRTIEIDGKEQTVAGFLEVSSALGRTYDEIARDLFGDGHPFEKIYPNVSNDQKEKFLSSIAPLVDNLKNDDRFKNGFRCITNEDALRVYGKVKVNGEMKTVAGTMDMIVIDSNGDVNIVDFKTKRSNRGNKFDENTLQGYSDQVHLYAKLLEEMYPSLKGHVRVLGLAKFELKYNEPNGSRDNENGKTDYIEENGQIFVVEEGKKILIQDTKGYSGALFTKIEEVKSPSKKMITDKLELKGEDVKIEGDKDFEEYLKKAQKELEERNKAKQEEEKKKEEEERLKKEAEEKAKKEEEERNANRSTAEALAKTQQIDDNSKNEYTLKNLGVSVISPFKLNQGQESALYNIDDFLASDESMMVLKGYAGTGKTSLMRILGDAAIKAGRHIQWCATTNAAAKNLMGIVNQPATSLHSQFGITVDKTGESDTNIDESKILPGIYIIDESSMISKENIELLYNTIEKINKRNSEASNLYGNNVDMIKVVFLGDPEQLPPVDEKDAPVFNKKKFDFRTSELTQVMRTGDNAILKEATALREGKDASYISHFNSKGEGVAYINTEIGFTSTIKALSESILNGQTLVLAASNNRVTALNKEIRKNLGYENSNPRVGESMMIYERNFYTNIKNPVTGETERHYFLVNGGSYKVLNVRTEQNFAPEIERINTTFKNAGIDIRLDIDMYKSMPKRIVTLQDEHDQPYDVAYYDVSLLNEKQLNVIRELGDQFDKEKLKKLMNERWEYFYSIPKVKETAEERYVLSSALFGLKGILNNFPIFLNEDVKDKTGKTSKYIKKSIDFGYACTIHKSQGMTVDNIIFDMNSIKCFNDEVLRRRSSYVAISRARKTVTVLSDSTKKQGNVITGKASDKEENPTKKSSIFYDNKKESKKSNRSNELSDENNNGDKDSDFNFGDSGKNKGITKKKDFSFQINISSMSESEKNKASHKEHLMFNRLIPDLSIEHRDNLVGGINRAIERGDSQSIIDMKNSIEMLCNPNIIAGKIFDDAINSIIPFVVDNENIQAIMQEIGEESLSKAYKRCIDGIDDYSDVTTKAFKSIDEFIKEFSKQKTRINIIIDNLTNGKTSDNKQFQKNIKKDDKKYSYNDEIKEYGIEENEWNEMTEEEKEHIKNVCL